MALRMFQLAVASAGLILASAVPPAHAAATNLVSRPSAAAAGPVGELIAQYPQGGAGLTAAIAGLVERSPDQAADVVAAARSASAVIASALAAGLAQAAAAFAVTEPATAEAIREAVYGSDERAFAAEFSLAYTVALAENPTAEASLQFARLPSANAAQVNNQVSPN